MCWLTCAVLQRYFGAAAGKGRQGARTTIERLNLPELTCRQAITEIAKMCAPLPARAAVQADKWLHQWLGL